MSSFRELGAEVIGISPDPVKSHIRFAEKLSLDYKLLSDPGHKLIEDYGFWQLKKMYGKEYMGVVRSTVLIDKDGNVEYLWDKVKVKGHAEEVLTKIQEYTNKM